MNWASWAELEDVEAARQTEKWAAQAELVVVATEGVGGLPNRMSWWLEMALRKRGDREGVLVGLPLPEAGLKSEAAAAQVHLRKLAHDNGMDYLTTLPESLPRPEPESVESYTRRATQVTSVLDRILHQAPLAERTLML